MASSLDELQPNDFFQLELEEFLVSYFQIPGKVNQPSYQRFILNQFIEFVCFHKNLENFDNITENVLTDFLSYLKPLIENQNEEYVRSILREYFLFIYQNRKKPPDFLIHI